MCIIEYDMINVYMISIIINLCSFHNFYLICDFWTILAILIFRTTIKGVRKFQAFGQNFWTLGQKFPDCIL